MVLFRVSTHYQLLSAIITKIQIIPDKEADLHLDETTDFLPYVNYLKKLNLFRKIELINQVKLFSEQNKNGNKEFFNTPNNVWNINVDVSYEDMYIGYDMAPHKCFFYYLKKLGQNPKVHILDEGVFSYHKDIVHIAEIDPINHEKYSEKDRYINNITEQLLYNPNLYMNTVPWPVNSIPKISEEAKKAYISLYEHQDNIKFPEQKLIFLLDGFSSVSHNSIYNNNADLIDICSSVLGKENIIAKKHPTHDVGSSVLHGYNILNTNIPWEYYLFKYDLSDRIIVSTSSTACLSSFLVLRTHQPVVFTCNCYLGSCPDASYAFGNKILHEYLKKSMKEYNADDKYIFMPENPDRFKETMIYINGKYGKGR